MYQMARSWAAGLADKAQTVIVYETIKGLLHRLVEHLGGSMCGCWARHLAPLRLATADALSRIRAVLRTDYNELNTGVRGDMQIVYMIRVIVNEQGTGSGSGAGSIDRTDSSCDAAQGWCVTAVVVGALAALIATVAIPAMTYSLVLAGRIEYRFIRNSFASGWRFVLFTVVTTLAAVIVLLQVAVYCRETVPLGWAIAAAIVVPTMAAVAFAVDAPPAPAPAPAPALPPGN